MNPILTRSFVLTLLTALSCDDGSSPAAPGIQSFSGVYSLEVSVNPHSCPSEAMAPAAGAHLTRTLILDDRRPNLSGTLNGVPMSGTITASGAFVLYDALEANRISGTVTSTGLSGRMTHDVIVFVGQNITHLCEWSEELSGIRQS